MAATPSSSPPREAPASPSTRPGQWILLIVGVLLSGAGFWLLVGAALASLAPEPGQWSSPSRHGMTPMAGWEGQRASQVWDQLQDAVPALLILGAVGFLLGLTGVLFGAAGLGRDIDPGRAAPASGLGRASDLRSGSESGPDVGAAAGVPEGAAVRYPVRLTGLLELPPSRGLWLVKWLLAIPHYVVLALLWSALFTTTLAAGVVILFTGRYPRSWFCFNVGVLRWSWRVGFYGYSALATDRYPPFSLAPAAYPADLSIAYPQRLSHGLVLVKSWLLAIPHLLLIAVFTSPSGSGRQGRWDEAGNATGYTTGGGFSLLGLLLLITAVVLLFTARYLPGIFDFVMGLNRWFNRVAAYVLLMRDEYPPFRLDQGPAEPPFTPANLHGSTPERTRIEPSEWTDWV